MFDGKMLIKNLNTDYFPLKLATEEIKIYSDVVNSMSFKMTVKLVLAKIMGH